MKKGICFMLLFFSLFAEADVFDTPKLETVMNRKYKVTNEFDFNVGYFPVGAYNKYVSVGGVFSYLLSEGHAWEVVNFNYMIELQSSLKKVLQTTPPFNQPPLSEFSNNLAVMKYLVTTNYVYSPFYTKALSFNSSIVHTQTSFAVGGGVGNYNIGTFPVVDLGLVQRFFFGEASSFKFDVRFYKFFTSQETVYNHLSLIFGYTFAF
jgi:outer membrane beta-barrel protein